METNPILKTQLGEVVHSRNEQYQSLQLELDLVKKAGLFYFMQTFNHLSTKHNSFFNSIQMKFDLVKKLECFANLTLLSYIYK